MKKMIRSLVFVVFLVILSLAFKHPCQAGTIIKKISTFSTDTSLSIDDGGNDFDDNTDGDGSPDDNTYLGPNDDPYLDDDSSEPAEHI